MLHYYGDWVRRFFFVGGVIMLAMLPLFRELIPIPVFVGAIIIVALILIAAFTHPESQLISGLNVAISAIAVVLFEYYAVQTLSLPTWDPKIEWFFWINHLLALDFLFALYYATKTFRGSVVQK